jgi:hypothetical protein
VAEWFQVRVACPVAHETLDSMTTARWQATGSRPRDTLLAGSLLEPGLFGDALPVGFADPVLAQLRADVGRLRRMRIVWRPSGSSAGIECWVPASALVRLDDDNPLLSREAGSDEQHALTVYDYAGSRETEATARLSTRGELVAIPVRFARSMFTEEGFSLPRIRMLNSARAEEAPSTKVPGAVAQSGCVLAGTVLVGGLYAAAVGLIGRRP